MKQPVFTGSWGNCNIQGIAVDEEHGYIYYSFTTKLIKSTLDDTSVLIPNEAAVEQVQRQLPGHDLIVGIAMSFAGSSRPASGSEHHLSHFYEIVGIARQESYFPHGIDIAFSTILTAALRKEILAKPFPNNYYRQAREEYQWEMKRVYGSSPEGCIALQDKVGNYACQRLPVYLEKETQIRQILQEMPGAVGLDKITFYDLYDAQKIANSISYAKDLKDRYTVLWLYYDLFGIHG